MFLLQERDLFMVERYPIPDDLRQYIKKYEEDAYGKVVRYLTSSFGLTRGKAQEPANQIINQVLTEDQPSSSESSAKSDSNTDTHVYLSKEHIISHLLETERFANFDYDFFDIFVDIYTKANQEQPGLGKEEITAIIYRKCLFNHTLRDLVPEDENLRSLIPKIVAEIQHLFTLSQKTHQEIDLKPRNISFLERYILTNVGKIYPDNSFFFNILLHQIQTNEPFFPSLLLAMDSVLNHILTGDDRFDTLQQDIRQSGFGKAKNFFQAPAIFPIQQKASEKKANRGLLVSLESTIKSLLGEPNRSHSVLFKKKFLLGSIITALIAQKINLFLKEQNYEIKGTLDNQIHRATAHSFLDLLDLSEDLKKHSLLEPFGDTLSTFIHLFNYKSVSGKHIFGERSTTDLSEREISMELERLSSNNSYWQKLLVLLKRVSDRDSRFYSFLCTLLYGIIPDMYSKPPNTLEFYNLENIDHFIEELIAYKNLNRYDGLGFITLQDTINQLDVSHILYFSPSQNTLFKLNKQQIFKYIEEQQHTSKTRLETIIGDLFLYVFDKQDEYVQIDTEKTETIPLDAFYRIISEDIKTQHPTICNIFLFNNQFHYISTLEFFDFLIRFISGETFIERELEVKYNDIEDIIQKPLIITLENMLGYLPVFKDRFQDFFTISAFFMVGETIELTHPEILSKFGGSCFADIIRNYSFYPGMGFLRISVIGKDDEASYLPLNLLMMSYGFEQLFSQKTTEGRMVVEFGQADKWSLPINVDEAVINKIQVPSLIEIIKQYSTRRSKRHVQSDIHALELGKFSQYFREFITGNNVLDINNDSSIIGLMPEYPLYLLKAFKSNCSYSFDKINLTEFSEIIKHAFITTSPSTNHKTEFKLLKSELEQFYTVKTEVEWDNLSSPLKKICESNIEGKHTTSKLLHFLDSLNAHSKYDETIYHLQKLNNVTKDIEIQVESNKLIFYTKMTLDDVQKRLLESQISIGEEVSGNWQLSYDMKLIFYKEISDKIKDMLMQKIGDQYVYEIIIPINNKQNEC